jgi:hypothetical protein
MTTARQARGISKANTNEGSWRATEHAEADPAVRESLAATRAEFAPPLSELDHANLASSPHTVSMNVRIDDKRTRLALGDHPAQRLEGTEVRWVVRSTPRERRLNTITGLAHSLSYTLRIRRPGSDNYTLGAPVVAEPIPLSRQGFMEQLRARIDRSYAGATWGVTDDEPAVVVTTVVGDNHERRHIVTIPGSKFARGHHGPTDWRADIHALGGAFEDRVNGREVPGSLSLLTFEAMNRAGIQRGEEVMLVGHSLGGIIAADIASRPETFERFNVTSIVTFGSPIGTYRVDGRVASVVAFEHEGDRAVLLDGFTNRNEGHPGYQAVKTKPTLVGRGIVSRIAGTGAHAMNAYVETASDFASGVDGQNWLDSNERFMSGTAAERAFPLVAPSTA